AERVAYDAQKAKVIAAQDDHKYGDANRELKALEVSMKALFDKKLEQVNQKVDEVTGAKGSANQAKALVDQLKTNPGLISEMSSEKQLELRKTLRNKVFTCVCGVGMDKGEYDANNKKCKDCGSANISYPKACRSCHKPGAPTNSIPCTYCGNTTSVF